MLQERPESFNIVAGTNFSSAFLITAPNSRVSAWQKVLVKYTKYTIAMVTFGRSLSPQVGDVIYGQTLFCFWFCAALYIYEIWQILKCFSGTFCWAQILKLGWGLLYRSIIRIPKQFSKSYFFFSAKKNWIDSINFLF